MKTEEASSLAEKHGITFMETSALDANNIDNVFKRLVTGKRRILALEIF